MGGRDILYLESSANRYCDMLAKLLQVGSQSAIMKMTPVPLHGGFLWQAFNEEPASNDDSAFTMLGLLEQLNTTRDASDYLWYMTE